MEPADRLSELLDGDTVQEPTFPEGTADVPPSELAKQLFVSGVLRHLLAEDDGHLDRQIGRAMASIDALAAQRSSMRRWLTWSLTAAAVVLIAFVVALQRPEDLMATINRVIAAAQQDVDREFAIRILPHEDAMLADQPQCRLIVRGSPKFALMIPLTMGDVWLGTDGEEFWVVPHIELLPVVTFSDRERMQRFAEELGIMIEAFQLANMLKRLRIDYELALTKDSTEAVELIDFTGRRRDDIDNRVPEYIKIVADRKTGKLHKLSVTWGPKRPPMFPLVMFAKLTNDEPKPDSFYGHDAHHHPDRLVREFRLR